MLRHVCHSAILLLTTSLTPTALAVDTLITEQNLNRFEQLMPKVMQIPRPTHYQRGNVNLQPHCDWQQHYQQLQAQQQQDNYLQQVEQVISAYDFTPQQFIELSAKITWPVLDAMQPMLELSRQAIVLLPPQQRKQSEASLMQSQHYHQVLTSCLTQADKAALAKHEKRIMALAAELVGSENDPVDMRQMLQMTRQ